MVLDMKTNKPRPCGEVAAELPQENDVRLMTGGTDVGASVQLTMTAPGNEFFPKVTVSRRVTHNLLAA